ncbi:MAG: SIS domain-containing protein [Pseudohongiella sp.]|nr:SIS domain-containing protein [Pseudohongiella sp.]MDP2286519.1 SIS domain-containing protein [Pseudohongiella sp.]
MTPEQRIQAHFQQSILGLSTSLDTQAELIRLVAERIAESLLQGGKILVCGNGGSAALASYFSALLLNRFERERPALPAIALSADSVAMTAIATDLQYRSIYAQQIRALGQHTDILLVLTSGRNSANLREAVSAAYDREMPVIVISCEDSGNVTEMLQSDDLELRVPAPAGYRSQEIQLTVLHCLCDLIDVQIFGEEI